MPNILHDLKITRVASVDKGAGEGVEILLSKEAEVEKKVTLTLGSNGGLKLWHENDSQGGSEPLVDKKTPKKAKSAMKKAIEFLKASVESIIGAPEAERPDLINKTFDEFSTDVQPIADVHDAVDAAFSADPTDVEKSGITNEEVDMTKEEMDAIKKQLADLTAEVTKTKDELAFEKLDVKYKEFAKAFPPDKKKEFVGKDDKAKDKDMEDCAKAALEVVPESVKKALSDASEAIKKAAAMEKEVEILKAEKATTELTKRASEIGFSDVETIRKARAGDLESVKKLEDTIKALNKQVKESGLFKEFGSGTTQGGSAYDQIKARADELKKVTPTLTDAKAFDKAFTAPENRDLVAQYRREKAVAA